MGKTRPAGPSAAASDWQEGTGPMCCSRRQTGPEVLRLLWQALKEHLCFKGGLPDPLRYLTKILTLVLSLSLTAWSLESSFASVDLEASDIW